MDLPTWFWGGSMPESLAAARLMISPADGSDLDIEDALPARQNYSKTIEVLV
jgi:hypothetical protein